MSGGFLGRWSRRKLAAAGKTLLADAPVPGQPAPAVAPHGAADASASAAAVSAPAERAAGSPAAEAQLPPVEALTLESDFTAFLKEEVSEALRRKALHKLFADPHFNRMDGLDVYIDDYSLPDPIPPEAMAKLQHAREWLMANAPEADAEAAASSAGQAAVARPEDEDAPVCDGADGGPEDARPADDRAAERGAAADEACADGKDGKDGKDDGRRTGLGMQGGDDALPAVIPSAGCAAIRPRQKAP